MKFCEESTPDQEFSTWLDTVDQLCLEKFGLSLDDLPDVCTRDAFDSGMTPLEFFQDDVLPMLREEFGELVDDL